MKKNLIVSILVIASLACSSCSTPLMKAIAAGDSTQVETIIQQSPSPHSKPESYSRTEGSDIAGKIIGSLVAAGLPCLFPATYRGTETTTPLILSIQENKPDIFTLLINSGVDVKVKDHKHLTALEQAAKMEEETMTKTLLSRGAKANDDFCSEAKRFLYQLDSYKKHREEQERLQKIEQDLAQKQAREQENKLSLEREIQEYHERQSKEEDKKQKINKIINSI